jgi:hypothetical protein
LTLILFVFGTGDITQSVFEVGWHIAERLSVGVGEEHVVAEGVLQFFVLLFFLFDCGGGGFLFDCHVLDERAI